MKTPKSLKSAGINARLFLTLMLVTVLGVLFKYPILYPLQLFFNRIAEYSSRHYSYKPGQNGWTYEFFVLNDDGYYIKITTLVALAISFLFYLGVFSSLTAVYNLVNHRMKPFKRDLLITCLAGILLVGLPKAVSVDDWFDINKAGSYWVLDRIYTSDGATLEIAEKRFRGVGINDHTVQSSDSCQLVIKRKIGDSSSSIYTEKLPKNLNAIDVRILGESLWLIHDKINYLKAINRVNGEVLVEDTRQLLPTTYQGNVPKVASMRGPRNDEHNYVTLNMSDGTELYLMLKQAELTDTKPGYRYRSEKYHLSRLNKHRFTLKGYRTILPDIWNDKVFLDAKMAGYNDELIIIQHKHSIEKEAPYSVTAYRIDTAKELWTINQADIEALNTIHGSLKVFAFFQVGKTMLNFKDAFTLKISMSVDNNGQMTTYAATADVFK